MAYLLSNPWLVVAGPLLLAALIGFSPRRLASIAPWVAVVGPVATIALGAQALLATRGAELPSSAAWNTSPLAAPPGGFGWFDAGQTVLSLGWAIDSLTAVMLLVVGVVAACVVVFSVGYMHGDAGWMRYFALLALFTGSMNLLVLGNTFTTLFIGWELVGACSYLLIGFWYQKPSAVSAAAKAFLTTRVGDVGLLLGIAILWIATGTDTYEGVLSGLGAIDQSVLTAAAICIAIGAIGKSAQFPLHAWLPDAMEGPTPVSALIHAATMVAAGVFLVARVWPLFDAAPYSQLVLLTAGAISAFGAALVATAQRDIKKVLAYSTISQLGFMFAALGVGAWPVAFFHLVAHAAFKGLLFLCSGSVIHGAGTQDLHEMGGLRKAMPVTFVAWVVGVLALAGVFPFAGFFSKDAVLESVWHAAPGVGVLLFAASALTAFYAARATRLAFFGAPAEGLHAHESGLSMTVPLIVLAVPASVLGFAATWTTHALGHEPEPLVVAVSVAALALAALGGTAGWMTSAGPAGDCATAHRLGRVHPLLAAAFRWNEAVDRWVVRPVVAFSRALWAIGDRLIADGVPEGSARLARRLGSGLSRLQTGDAQSYTAVLAVGVLLMLVVSIWLGR